MFNDVSCSVNQLSNQSTWVGRFAPSPTGDLHLGSLVAAVASYLVAKSKAGKWLVRIEDLDRPREVKGASKSILACLENFGLYWDGEVEYQSQRNKLYQERIDQLIDEELVYQCCCSRKDILNRNNGIYDGYCRQHKFVALKENAYRIKFGGDHHEFDDQILGKCCFNSSADKQDFIVRRRGGLFAYQLAVVADDIDQGINHVVRGEDILDSTPRQNYLYDLFKLPSPLYFHLPLVKGQDGSKMSKQAGALGLRNKETSEQLLKALKHLGQKIDPFMNDAKPSEIIRYFEKHWSLNYLIDKTKE